MAGTAGGVGCDWVLVWGTGGALDACVEAIGEDAVGSDARVRGELKLCVIWSHTSLLLNDSGSV